MMKKFVFLLLVSIVQNASAEFSDIKVSLENKNVSGRPAIVIKPIHTEGFPAQVVTVSKMVKLQDHQTQNAIWSQVNAYASKWKFEVCKEKDWFGEFTFICVKNDTQRIPFYGHRVAMDEHNPAFIVKSAVLHTEAKIIELAYNYQKQQNANAVVRCQQNASADSYAMNIDGLLETGLWQNLQVLYFNSTQDVENAVRICNKNTSAFQVVQNNVASDSAYYYNYSSVNAGCYIQNTNTKQTSKYIESYDKALQTIVTTLTNTLQKQNITFETNKDRVAKAALGG